MSRDGEYGDKEWADWHQENARLDGERKRNEAKKEAERLLEASSRLCDLSARTQESES